jgi:hypothetical protein
LRYVGAFIVLMLAGLGGSLGWITETCTGNAPDSLVMGVFVLPLNVLGVSLLAWRPKPWPLAATAILPALLAIPYTLSTFELAHGYLARGIGACDVLTDYGPWGPSGDEPHFITIWLSAVAVLWLGMALAAWRAYRSTDEDMSVERAS